MGKALSVADLPQPLTWWTSLATWARGLVTPRTEVQVQHGADYSAGTRIAQDYDPRTARSAAAAFPWVRACVDAIGTDLAGLPWIATVGEGANAEVLDGHPAVALLNDPTSWQTGEEWERQALLDLLLTGNAYAVRVGARSPSSLPLLHPARVRIEPTKYGAPLVYLYGVGGEDRYEPADIIHIRFSSWQDSTQSLLGEGLIRALHDDLTADQAAARLSAKASQRGRPDAIIRPKDGVGMWDADVRGAIAKAYDEQIKRGGALVISDAIEAEFPTYTPRDMEFAEARRLTRETVLAAFGVPPARVGLPTANYATQEQQNVVYWQGLQGLSRLMSGRLTKALGRAFPGQPVTIRKDFSGVPALQESRNARQARVKVWVDLGMPAADAAAYEGFTDAPGLATVQAPAPVATPTQGAPQADPAPARGLTLLRGGETAATEAPAVVVRERLDVPTDPAARDSLWRSFLSAVHTPTERALTTAVADELAAQAERLSRRLESAPWPVRQARQGVLRRDLTAEVMAALFPPGEGQELPEEIRAILDAALRAGFRSAVGYIGERYDYAPSMLDAAIQASIGSWVRVATTTQDAVQAVVDRGIREGWTIYEMQRQMVNLPAFTPTRARVVARTETTRAVNGGAQDAYATAMLNGVDLRKEWLTARDLDVRFDHDLLDGQRVHTGELFTIPEGEYAGAQARYPGDFHQAALVVNCRCTTIPVVIGAR